MRSRPPAKRVVPKRLLKLLGDAPLMQFENEDEYNSLLSEYALALDPRDFIEWSYVKDVVDHAWEIQRLRQYRTWIITIDRRYGLADIFGVIADQGDLTPEEKFAAGAKMAAAFCDGDFDRELKVQTVRRSQYGNREVFGHFSGNRRQLLNLWKQWDFDEEAISAATFLRNLASMETLDRLIASAEARRNRAIREIESRRAGARAKTEPPRLLEHEGANASRRSNRR